jgi:hypothetical protein
MTDGLTRDASRFYDFDSKLVLKRRAETFEKAQREEVEEIQSLSVEELLTTNRLRVIRILDFDPVR